MASEATSPSSLDWPLRQLERSPVKNSQQLSLESDRAHARLEQRLCTTGDRSPATTPPSSTARQMDQNNPGPLMSRPPPSLSDQQKQAIPAGRCCMAMTSPINSLSLARFSARDPTECIQRYGQILLDWHLDWPASDRRTFHRISLRPIRPPLKPVDCHDWNSAITASTVIQLADSGRKNSMTGCGWRPHRWPTVHGELVETSQITSVDMWQRSRRLRNRRELPLWSTATAAVCPEDLTSA